MGIVIWNKAGRTSQRWNVEGNQLKSIGGKCLDAGDNRRGSWARIHTCHGGSNQSWTFYDNYTIKNNGSGLCLGLGQSGSGTISLGNGIPLIMVNCNKDNCSTYFSSDALTGYNLSTVDPQCVRDVGLTPVTPPPPAPTPQNPNPQPYYNPVGNGGNNNNNPPPVVNPPGGNIPPPPYVPPVRITKQLTPLENQLSSSTPVATIDRNDILYKGQRAALSLVSDVSEISNGLQICGINPICQNTNSQFNSARTNLAYGTAAFIGGLGVGYTIDVAFGFLLELAFSNPYSGTLAFIVIASLIINSLSNIDLMINVFGKDLDYFSSSPFYQKMFWIGFNITLINGLVKSVSTTAIKTSSGLLIFLKEVVNISKPTYLTGKQLANRFIGGLIPNTSIFLYDLSGNGVAKAKGWEVLNFLKGSTDEAANAALKALDDPANNQVVKNYLNEKKYVDQARIRGWTDAKIDSAIKNPYKTQATTDVRYYNNGSGLRRNDPATVYFISENQYVVINNIDGTVVQVSDLLDPLWKVTIY